MELADQSGELGRKSFEAGQIARLDLVRLEVEAERLRADAESAERELPAAFRRVAAAAGDPRLPLTTAVGTLDAALPEYDPEQPKEAVLAFHPRCGRRRSGSSGPGPPSAGREPAGAEVRCCRVAGRHPVLLTAFFPEPEPPPLPVVVVVPAVKETAALTRRS